MPTVLVIDDHEVIAFSVQSAVPDWTVLYAADGVMGLDLFRHHSAGLDLVVLDIQMPYLDGRAVCVAIRSLRPSIPILPFTGYPDSGTLALFAEFGCAPPLIKPVAPVVLATTLHSLVGQPPPPMAPGHGLVIYAQQLVMTQERLGRMEQAPTTCIYAAETVTRLGLQHLLEAAGAMVVLQSTHIGTIRQALETQPLIAAIATTVGDLPALLEGVAQEQLAILCMVTSLAEGLRAVSYRQHPRRPRLGIVLEDLAHPNTTPQYIAATLRELSEGADHIPASLQVPFAGLDLAPREQTHLAALLQYPSPAEAARHLGVAPDSIRQYRKRIRHKLQLAEDQDLEKWVEAWWRRHQHG